ncbi:MAG: hypothetical protein MGF17_05250 [Trichodesmium sp. MAG_R04]|nr:hypothetical protein [Trichodesmium sp. MAG_R04]
MIDICGFCYGQKNSLGRESDRLSAHRLSAIVILSTTFYHPLPRNCYSVKSLN